MSGDDGRGNLSKGLANFSNFIDDHLRLVRSGVCALAALTLLGLARHFRLFSKFRFARDIPPEFFRKNVKLRGTVVQRSPDGATLKVNHLPAINLKLVEKFDRRRAGPDTLLPVSLAGVKVTERGQKWIDHNLINQTVWFRLLESGDTESIPAILTHRAKYGLLRRNINILLVKNGMAQVASEDDYTITSLLYGKLLGELIKHEKKAERRGVGDWTKLTWSEWFKDKISRRGRPR